MLKIGELANKVGCQVETVRFYEREGLLPPPGRSEANYRIYGEEHVARLQFIRHCRTLDMTLDEIRILLRLRDSPMEDCHDVDVMLDRHILQVEERVRQLQQLQRQLEDLRGACRVSRSAKDCGILRRLDKG